MMKCYWQQTDDTSTTKQRRIAYFSIKAYFSRKTTEKLAGPDITKLSFQSGLLMTYSENYMEILVEILESSNQKLRTEKNITMQLWRNWSRSGFFVSKIHHRTTNRYQTHPLAPAKP